VLVNLCRLHDAAQPARCVRSAVATTDIPDSDAWLAALRSVRTAGRRTVLIEQLTVEQNLAIPLTLDGDPLPDALKAQIRTLGAEVGWRTRSSAAAGARPLDLQRLPPRTRARARFRACCSRNTPPRSLERADAGQLARDMSRIVSSRAMAGGVHHRRPRVRAASRLTKL
jgi:hypothetical protein